MFSFHVKSETVAVLGITTYLFGLAVGSIVLAPLSEMYGRRPVYIIAMALFAILVLPCALAHKLETILITRFIGALFGAAMISNAPGSVNDIVSGISYSYSAWILKFTDVTVEEYRSLALSVWSIGPMNGVRCNETILVES
jgi:MFS family permease